MFDEHIEEARHETEPSDRRKTVRKFTHQNLRIRIFVYFIIALIMVGVVVYDILTEKTTLTYSLMALVIGLIVGIVVSRMFRISWDKDAQMVISSLDTLGVIVLIIYFLLEIFRKQIAAYFFHSELTLSLTFAALAGIMIGRVIGMRFKVRKILEEHL
jgi:FtsH-binding integral membrane protein